MFIQCFIKSFIFDFALTKIDKSNPGQKNSAEGYSPLAAK